MSTLATMTTAEALLQEFEQETALTRRVLERVPMEKRDWRPHPKSRTFGELAAHLTEFPLWASCIIEEEEFVYDPETYKAPSYEDSQSLLEGFDKGVAIAKEALSGKSEEYLRQPWRFIVDGKVAFEMPRIAVFREMVLSHSVHHRAQLGVYLRLNDIPVPQTYGPTADEPEGGC